MLLDRDRNLHIMQKMMRHFLLVYMICETVWDDANIHQPTISFEESKARNELILEVLDIVFRGGFSMDTALDVVSNN